MFLFSKDDEVIWAGMPGTVVEIRDWDTCGYPVSVQFCHRPIGSLAFFSFDGQAAVSAGYEWANASLLKHDDSVRPAKVKQVVSDIYCNLYVVRWTKQIVSESFASEAEANEHVIPERDGFIGIVKISNYKQITVMNGEGK
jgi:hypothetical protein